MSFPNSFVSRKIVARFMALVISFSQLFASAAKKFKVLRSYCRISTTLGCIRRNWSQKVSSMP
eukprot:3776973-Pleurochrysis_carterae.AAC.1